MLLAIVIVQLGRKLMELRRPAELLRAALEVQILPTGQLVPHGQEKNVFETSEAIVVGGGVESAVCVYSMSTKCVCENVTHVSVSKG